MTQHELMRHDQVRAALDELSGLARESYRLGATRGDPEFRRLGLRLTVAVRLARKIMLEESA